MLGDVVKFDWTPEAVGKLHIAWDAGDSTAKIGKDIGCGKNAVIGKARREGLPKRKSPIKYGPRLP